MIKQSQLQPFCDDGPGIRWSLEKPWQHHDHVYATDGRALLQVLATDYEGELDDGHHPDPVPIMAAFTGDDWQPLPDNPPASTDPKAHCDSCGGSNVIDCDCCGYKGPCFTCDGTGIKWVVVAGQEIARDEYRRLRTLPGIEVCANPDGTGSRLSIRFAGGIGIVMGESK